MKEYKMEIKLPDVNIIFRNIIRIQSTLDKETKQISEWLDLYRREIKENKRLLKEKSEDNDMSILCIFLRDLLVRAIKGEAAFRVHDSLKRHIKKKTDLHDRNYQKILKEAKYRWGYEGGAKTISDVVMFFKDTLKWNFEKYIQDAENESKTNFQDDGLLKIKNIKFKLRDLALSNFSLYYPAMDLHISRIISRTGLTCYGYEFIGKSGFEIGNNPSDEKNYLFLHRLFIEISKMTKDSSDKYLPSEIDRIFWHFGRTICKSKPRCRVCPINGQCLQGKCGKI